MVSAKHSEEGGHQDHSRNKPSLQSGGGCIDISAKLDICTATDPETVFDVPQSYSHPRQSQATQSRIKIEHHHDVQQSIGGQPESRGLPEEHRPSSAAAAVKSKLLKNYCAIVDGCSRTTPVIWARDHRQEGGGHVPSPVKQELCIAVPAESSSCVSKPGTGNAAGMNFVNIKIEPKSPNCQGSSLAQATSLDMSANRDAISTMDTSAAVPPSHYSAAGQIPVGIAVARQRLHPDPALGATGTPNNAALKDLHGSRHLGPFVEMIPGPQLGNNIFLSTPSSTPAMIGSWQYPMEPMQMPLPPVGLQLVREPTTGQYVFVPAMEPYPQAVVWPYANVQPTQPGPIQFLGASDYLSASTTLHQHTQTSTRLVALPSNDMKQRYLPTNPTTVPGIPQSTTAPTATSDPTSAAALMSIVNKVPSLNPHLLPSGLNNTIIKIEDSCAIGAPMAPQDHLSTFAMGPSINTPAELINANLTSGGFLMPHTPMLTPAPSMFDMNDKPFLANIAQQQRQFQFNLNSSMKSESCSILPSETTLAPVPDYASLLYPQPPSLTGTDFTSQQLPPVPANCLPSVTTLDASAMGLGTHPTIMLTPPTVLAARSTGGLLTPPSPMPPPKPAPGSQAQQPQIAATGEASQGSLLTVCSMDVLSASQEASEVNKVQDATMQTDTPVCSDEENTQDTALSEAYKESKDSEGAGSKSDAEVCHNDIATMTTELGSAGCVDRVSQGTVTSPRRAPVDLSGLELLSNSIEAFETIKRETRSSEDVPEGEQISTPDDAVTSAKEPTEVSVPVPQPQIHHSEHFDGLNLLCALAEQRLVEEEGEEQLSKPPGSVVIEPPVTPVKTEGTNSKAAESSSVDKLTDMERNMTQRLADLTRQCEEKQRILEKMEKINPFYRMGYAQSYPVPSKFAMSDDEETRSSRSASVRTPLTPTLLFGTNSNGQGNSFNSTQSDVPKVSSDTESSRYDDGDMSSLEKMSKRKGVLPKKWDDCSETETIVAKKPKNLAGYIFSSKSRNENENKLVCKAAQPLIKHGQLRTHFNPSPSSGSTSSEQIKFVPIKIKEEILDDDGVMPVTDLFKSNSNTLVVKSAEERKHRKRNKSKKRHHKDPEERKKRKTEGDNRCKLTDAHLDDKEKKTRVLTSMGGLFYAGVLSPIQPPDIYSVILDGERGNRPHIMSREEVQRDAVLEIIPKDPSEVPPGTRLCAYWSQQYRCLYPGTAAQPGTPDVNSKKQYISVEFDDGDSGRIAIGDIRLLFRDYPIVEYDPNPLLSLGKRKGKAGVPGSIPETGFNALIGLGNRGIDSQDRLDRAAEKERRRMKKMKKLLLRKQQQLQSSCPCQTIIAEDGTKKKIRCSEESCKHKRHKKKRKHKKHSQDRETSDAQKMDRTPEKEEVPTPLKISAKPAGDANLLNNAEANDDTEETMDSCSAADDPDFKDPSNKKKDQPSPEQKKSKIAAFLPARQLWAWAGESYRRSCVKGRVKKQFYKMIQRGKETIEVGDSAVFLSTGRPDRPYIGRITSMWKTNACNMIVRVKWFYHPEETQGCPRLKYPGGLFESPHEDENDVQTISHKCEVLSVYDFIRKLGDDPKNLSMIYDNNDTYYLAGNYDPTALQLTMQPDIPTTPGGT